MILTDLDLTKPNDLGPKGTWYHKHKFDSQFN